MASVHRLHYASVLLDGKYNPPSFQHTRIDVFGYLILAADDAILIDTGVGRDNSYINENFQPVHTDLNGQLAEYNISTTDISHVINSHLHFDHCGNNRLFPHSRFVIQSEELKAASEKFYTLNDWFDFPGADLCAVSGDAQIIEDVRVIPTPGHTPGHQSVLVDTSNGTTIIAAQAAFKAEEFERGGDPEVQAHEGFADIYGHSIQRLKEIPATRIVFSHDDAELSSPARN